MKTLLFLDVDGVLNSNNWCWTHERTAKDKWAHIDSERVKIMNRLCDAIDCDVVISSTYRICHNLSDLRCGLREKGATFWKRVIGKTDQKGSVRGHQIARYVELHIDWTADVPKIVIIDDSTDMDNMIQYLVRTNADTGIVESDIDKAIAIINNQ